MARSRPQQPSTIANERGEQSLNERISDVFGEYFSILEGLQKAGKVSQKDLDRLDAATIAIQECERRAKGGVDEGSRIFLSQLRALLDAATTNVNSGAEFVGDGGKKESKRRGAVRQDRDVDAESNDRRRAARAVAEAPKDTRIDVKAEAKYWSGAVERIRFDLDQMDRALLSYNSKEDVEADETYFVQTLGSTAVDFNELLQALGQSGATEVPEPLKPILADLEAANVELAALRDRIARFDELKRERAEAAMTAEALAKTFIASAEEGMHEIPRILALPSGTAEERFVLRAEIDNLARGFKRYYDDWKTHATVHLPRGEAWLPIWQDAVRANDQFSKEYKKIKERQTSLDGDRAVDFERNYAVFEGKIAVFRSRLLKTDTMHGSSREVHLQGLQTYFSDLKHEWQDLRRQAPRLTEAERAALGGQDTPVQKLDRAIGGPEREGGIEKQLKGLLSEKDPRVLKAQEVIANLARTVVRANGDIWVAATRYPARDEFLRRYLDHEVADSDPEFSEFIVNRERFQEAIGPLSAAYLQVTRQRRAREDREARRRTREAERAEQQRDIARRRSIRHPWVVDLRAREQDRFEKILYSESWKIQNLKDRKNVMDHVAEMDDAALEEKLDGVADFRSACAELSEAKAKIRGAEDELLEGRELRPEISVAEAQSMVERYHELRRLQSRVGRVLAQSRAWSPRVEDRFAAAVAFRDVLFSRRSRDDIQKAFSKIARNPRELGPLMERWIDSTSERYALGQAINFALDIHPELRERGVLRGLPKEFRLVQASVAAEGMNSDAASAGAAVDAREGVVEDETGFGADLAGSMDATAASLMSVLNDEGGGLGSSSVSPEEPASGSAQGPVPAYSAAGGAASTPEAAVSVDARAQLLKENESWSAIKRLLADDVFWTVGTESGTRGTMLAAYRRTGKMNTKRLREDRVTDFEYALGFTNLADLERRVAEIRAKYVEAAPVAAPVAESASAPATPSEPVPVETSAVAAVPSGASKKLAEAPAVVRVPESARAELDQLLAADGFSSDADAPKPLVPVRRNIAPLSGPAAGSSARAPQAEVPRPPRPVDDVVLRTPVRSESVPGSRVESAPVRSIPIPASESDDPFARFFNGGSGGRTETPVSETRPAARVEAPRPPRAELAPVPSVRPATAAVQSEPAMDSVAQASARVEIPIEVPVEALRETHPEDRVAQWSRSLRNTVGRIFGGAASVPAAVESSAVRAESVPSAEVSRRTAGGVMGVLSRFFGAKIFADVPRYLPESFGDQNARALLQADILDAMEENSAAMKNAAADPERIYAANLDAAARLDRAIMTSTRANGEPLPEAEKARLRSAVAALSEKYAERTRENAAARSRELAGIVEQSVRVLEAPGRRGSPALRLLSRLPFNIGTNLVHGVGDFRKRFESAISRGGDTGLVARVATVFRETWQEAMQGIRGNGSLGDRAMNTAEAVAMIGSAYGLNAAITGLEKVLPNLRLLDGGERDELSRLAAEGRLQVQDAVDNILPRAEQVMKRAA